MNQSGFAALYMIVIFLLLLGASLFSPIPYYHGEIVCKPGQVDCPQPGWRLGPSLWNKYFPSRITSRAIQETPFSSPTTQQIAPSQKPCMTDAMICPDGVGSVGRIGPNCEFEKCPDPDSLPSNFNSIKSHITGAKCGPGNSNCPQGLECWKLEGYDKSPICVDPKPQNWYCPVGKKSSILEMYPPIIKCE